MSDNTKTISCYWQKQLRLYEKHGVGRPEPFNVFSSLQNKNGYLNENSALTVSLRAA